LLAQRAARAAKAYDLLVKFDADPSIMYPQGARNFFRVLFFFKIMEGLTGKAIADKHKQLKQLKQKNKTVKGKELKHDKGIVGTGYRNMLTRFRSRNSRFRLGTVRHKDRLNGDNGVGSTKDEGTTTIVPAAENSKEDSMTMTSEIEENELLLEEGDNDSEEGEEEGEGLLEEQDYDAYDTINDFDFGQRIRNLTPPPLPERFPQESSSTGIMIKRDGSANSIQTTPYGKQE